MNKTWLLVHVFVLTVIISSSAYPDDIQTQGKVCPNPSVPCRSSKFEFPPYALSFRLPSNLKWLNNYRSVSFYSVLLKSMTAIPDPDGPAGPQKCSGYISDTERVRVQAMFPTHKVFTSRFGCGSPGIGYTGVNYDYNFLAVYAGETKGEAEQFLARVKATKTFPDANIRRMQVVLDYGD